MEMDIMIPKHVKDEARPMTSQYQHDPDELRITDWEQTLRGSGHGRLCGRSPSTTTSSVRLTPNISRPISTAGRERQPCCLALLSRSPHLTTEPGENDDEPRPLFSLFCDTPLHHFFPEKSDLWKARGRFGFLPVNELSEPAVSAASSDPLGPGSSSAPEQPSASTTAPPDPAFHLRTLSPLTARLVLVSKLDASHSPHGVYLERSFRVSSVAPISLGAFSVPLASQAPHSEYRLPGRDPGPAAPHSWRWPHRTRSIDVRISPMSPAQRNLP